MSWMQGMDEIGLWGVIAISEGLIMVGATEVRIGYLEGLVNTSGNI